MPNNISPFNISKKTKLLMAAQNHMKQSDLGESLYPDAEAES
jgi:hypothetical protein